MESGAGNVHSSYQLALHYSSTDKLGAFLLFKTAAERGYSPARYELGMCYKNGNGCGIDYAQAVHWLTQASQANH